MTEKFAEEARKSERNKIKNIEKQRNLKVREKEREKNEKKNILWNTQLRNSKCLTFVFYFYQLETA